MLEVVLAYVVIKQIFGYYTSDEQFRETIWKRQVTYTLVGFAVISVGMAVSHFIEGPIGEVDFSYAVFFAWVFYVEKLLLGWIKTVRRSVGHVLMDSGRYRMNKALLMSRTFIAVFSMYLVFVISGFLMIHLYRTKFIAQI